MKMPLRLRLLLIPVCAYLLGAAVGAAQSAAAADPEAEEGGVPPQKKTLLKPAPLNFAVEDAYRARQSFDSRWTFERDQPGKVPDGWEVAETKPGFNAAWEVVEEKDEAPQTHQRAVAVGENKKVAELKNKEDKLVFDLLLPKDVRVRDLVLQADVRIRGGTGVDAGLVWRVQDAKNYYFCRWNAKEDNFLLYKMADGKRVLLASAKVEGDPSLWHELWVKQTGSHIRAKFDKKRMMSIVDDTYREAGGVGVYARAGSTTEFADVRLTKGVENGVVFFDPLKDGTIGMQSGGRFVEGGGWTLTRNGDRIVWDLPSMPPNGMVEVDIRNFNPPVQATKDYNVFIGLWGNLFDTRDRYVDPADKIDSDNYEIRMGKNWGAGFKLLYHANGVGSFNLWEPLKTFDPKHTYHLRMEWRDGQATTWLDEHKIVFDGNLPAPAKGVPAEPLKIGLFNSLHIGASAHTGDDGTFGPIYSNVKVTAFGP